MLRISANCGWAYFSWKMEELDPAAVNKAKRKHAADLVKRLSRYRGRVEAEGRQKSVRLIDRIIENLDEEHPQAEHPQAPRGD